MVRKRALPFMLTLGLLLGLLAFLSVSRAGEVRADQSAPWGVQPAALGAQGFLTNTRPVSGTQPKPAPTQPAISVPVTATLPATVTAVVSVTAPFTDTAGPPPTPQLPIIPLQPDEVLTGTIVLNRTEKSIFFFLDNDLYELPANRATGLQLARPLAGLTIFTCASDVDDATCEWISYPIRRSAFYEVSADADTPEPANLRLAVAAPPPLETAWIQNRTGADALLPWGEALLEIPNTGLAVVDGAEAARTPLYLPHCLQSSNQRICEWLPVSLNGGIFYALVETKRSAGINGVILAQNELTPLLLQEALITPTPTPEPEPEGIFCQTQIPSLNVRSGPGTNYPVIGKLRTSDANQGRVLAVGRTTNGAWLAVDPRFVQGGWVASAPQWILCEGAIETLPVTAEEVQVQAIPAPNAAPVPVIEPTPIPPTTEEPTATPEPEPQSANGLGPKQALLIATNSFEYRIRFTLDAAFHGLPEGTPSEYDLEPGQSIPFIIRAGRVQFSASTAWRDGSGNAEFEMGEGASRELFLRFEPAENDPNRWEMKFE